MRLRLRLEDAVSPNKAESTSRIGKQPQHRRALKKIMSLSPPPRCGPLCRARASTMLHVALLIETSGSYGRGSYAALPSTTANMPAGPRISIPTVLATPRRRG